MIEGISFWHWWILAVILIVIEILSPMVFALWMAVSAGVVGIILMIAPEMDWKYQLLVFSVLSVVSIVFWRFYLRKNPTKTDHPTLSRRGEKYIGRAFTLSEPIKNGRGRINVDDTSWAVSGEDCESISEVRVTGVDGTLLIVEPVKGEFEPD
jgi:inner membrane protein